MERWKNRVALITGASSGIGSAVAQLLLSHGLKVVACARRQELLHHLAHNDPSLFPYKCDLSNDEEVEQMFDWIHDNPELGRIDICVANAGFSTSHSLLEGNSHDWRKMLDVNVISLCLCTQLSIKSMTKHQVKDGHVIYINSMGGHRMTGGKLRFYSATKYMVSALLEGWRKEICELDSFNVKISAVSPGLVRTEFLVKSVETETDFEKQYGNKPMLTSHQVAECVCAILATPATVQIHDMIVRPTGINCPI